MGLYEPDEHPLWELDPPIMPKVHELRGTQEGLQYLRQTGQFKEYMEERLSRYNTNRKFKDAIARPFIAWDGEGWTDTDGSHRYMLMMASTGDHIEAPLINTQSCIDLILKVGYDNKEQKPIHIIYGGGYDVTHILREMPDKYRAALLRDNEVRWNDYHFEYIPHKWFSITGKHKGERVRVKIYDVMTFFQSSFIKALQSRGLNVDDYITQGKADRANFTFADMDEIKTYCQLEIESLVHLADQLRDEFVEAGLPVTSWHGPGAVATATLKHYGIQQFMEIPSDRMERITAHGYFGGRFELFRAGHHDGRVYQADINSAYPYALTQLPNLSGATWEYTECFDPDAIGIWFCVQDSTLEHHAPNALPWRSADGRVGFPSSNGGVWVWGWEARLGNSPHQVRYGYILHPATDEKPFAFIAGLFETRKRWKSQGKAGERALKLAMNSCYGKLCQSIGDGKRPTWHQLEWAGMITSITRAMLWQAIQLNPSSVISVETDSVTTTSPLNLNYGDGLGQWDYTEFDWITYLQSGVYFSSADSVGKSKTRGIDVREISHDKVMQYLALSNEERAQHHEDHGPQCNCLIVNSRQFVSMTHPGKDRMYGQWQDSIKEVRIGEGKRIHVPGNCAACASGLKMSESLHSMQSHIFYGHSLSAPHHLPWLDQGSVISGRDDSLPAPVDTEAIEEWR